MDDPHLEQSVTSVEVSGFIGWITSAAAYVLYLLWAYPPDAVLHRHAITYYPSKYWSLALPTWICVTVLCAYWAYESLNMIYTNSDKRNREVTMESLDVSKAYFSRSKSERLLPLVEIPLKVIDLVHSGMNPHEAEVEFKRQWAAARRGGEEGEKDLRSEDLAKWGTRDRKR